MSIPDHSHHQELKKHFNVQILPEALLGSFIPADPSKIDSDHLRHRLEATVREFMVLNPGLVRVSMRHFQDEHPTARGLFMALSEQVVAVAGPGGVLMRPQQRWQCYPLDSGAFETVITHCEEHGIELPDLLRGYYEAQGQREKEAEAVDFYNPKDFDGLIFCGGKVMLMVCAKAREGGNICLCCNEVKSPTTGGETVAIRQLGGGESRCCKEVVREWARMLDSPGVYAPVALFTLPNPSPEQGQQLRTINLRERLLGSCEFWKHPTLQHVREAKDLCSEPAAVSGLTLAGLEEALNAHSIFARGTAPAGGEDTGERNGRAQAEGEPEVSSLGEASASLA
ncbi:hypothetical protein DUNSADRAFT_3796 [Dunaliella salina]|uniref:Uncharacterized protein n=1 Tax=Dunaliella salina TaxID=3046 RepID=A0ABQ7GT99_DUNSA|nr:hypothetical protein DUNSADRAFT_3796 [Dunaliella salina]|eukprot:KAF5837833.1 hypothetical protein DUNSADRAFT_3796 [Dunaliella salina]